MPQLDTTTYLGQVTWFTVVFTGFYLIVLTDVLPRLNRAIKVRAKKLERTRDDARQFDTERSSADAAYARATSIAAASSLTLLTDTQSIQTKWMTDTAWGLSNTSTGLSEANLSYLDAVVLADASVGVLRGRMTTTSITDGDMELDGQRANPELFE
jgi:hypothetical protein